MECKHLECFSKYCRTKCTININNDNNFISRMKYIGTYLVDTFQKTTLISSICLILLSVICIFALHILD